MASEHWTQTELRELGELRNGVNFSRNDEGAGIPVLKVKDFGDRMFVPTDGLDELAIEEERIPEAQYLQKNDIVIIRSNGNSALVGRSMIFPGSDRPMTFSGFCIRFRPDTTVLDPRFAVYYLKSPFCRQRFSAFGSGTGIQNLSQGILNELPFPLPPIEEQRAIASILGALDDKIELNRRMNATLESLARAIFKSWFVDFDPVHVNAGLALTGQMPASSAIPTTHDPKVLELFPSTFQDSELGPIPEGWTVGTVRELCNRVENGGTPKRKVDEYWSPHEVPWLTSGEVRQSVITKTENFISKEGLENSSAKLWPPLTTVVALYGATAGFATFLGIEVSANQACCALIPKPEAVTFNLLTLQGAFQRLIQQARGSAQQNLSQSIVADLKTLIPSEKVLNAFNQHTLPLIEACAQNERESASVADARDKLLPQLLSGELPVPEALTQAEEVPA